MGLAKTSRALKYIGDYQAPDLFPDEARYRRYSEKRAYVAERLGDLASRDALFLTDLANQPRNLIALANDVIHGVAISDSADGRLVSAAVPPSLAGYQVTVKSMDGKPLRWKGGREAVRTYGGDSIRDKHQIFEDFYWESDKDQERLSVQHAWQALRQNGKHCRHAPSEGSRRINWTIEEVKPAGYDEYFSGMSDGLPAKAAPAQQRGIRRAG